tara:strand:- start:93 stop:446 length:354 start_codon:yes stop_codon:yes gene_type:complete
MKKIPIGGKADHKKPHVIVDGERVNTGNRFNVKYKQYRNRCYNYIIENGPCTVDAMLGNIRSVEGKELRHKPTRKSLTRVLVIDPRFVEVDRTNSSLAQNRNRNTVTVWGIVGGEEE